MIPRRLKVKGFMSYREEVEITFRGSTLWALLGGNGAGKSSLFDAIFFALYGEHRLGHDNHTQLIHYSANQFSIEFDFTIGDDEYSIKRIITKRASGGHTTQAKHLCGPNAPDPTRPSPQVIPGTEMVKGLKEWVINTLGFDKKTFVFSVLLQQGRSEALLAADEEDRRRLLSQIIDLSAYERLYKRAYERHRDEEKEADRLTKQLSQFSLVDPATLLTLQQEIDEAQKQKAAALAAQVQLSDWKARSEHWQTLVRELENVEQQLAQGQKLLAQAVLIERNAARRQTLTSVMPLLWDIFTKRDARAQMVQRIEADRKQYAIDQAQLEQLTRQKQQQQQTIQSLEQHKEEGQAKQNTISEQMADLLPPLQEIIVLEKKQSQCTAIQQQLAAIPEDLERQSQPVQDELQQLALMKQALPLLQHFSTARQTWQQAKAQHAVLLQLRVTKEQEQAQARQRVTDLLDQIAILHKKVEEAQQKLTRQQTLYDESHQRGTQFHKVEHRH